MLINKTFKVRLYPNGGQEQKMNALIDGTRFVYNHYLEQRKNHYLENKKTLPYATMARDLTKLRHTTEHLQSLQAEPLQQSLRRLDTAYNRFFRKTSKFPRFKNRFESKQSFQKHQDWSIQEGKIRIQKDLTIKYRGTINENADMGTLIVVRHAGRWYASITTKTVLVPTKNKTEPIGVDVGVETLATLSTGEKFPNLQAQKSFQKKLSKAQRALAKKQKGSKRREKAKLQLARIYQKIANVRSNHLHNTSNKIVNKNPSLIAVENLSVSRMMKNRVMARSVADTSMGELLRQITYKQEWRGGEIVEIDRYFPSSKTCSKCGFILDELPLSKRKWECPQCKTTHDRDVNAAKVILKQAKNS